MIPRVYVDWSPVIERRSAPSRHASFRETNFSPFSTPVPADDPDLVRSAPASSSWTPAAAPTTPPTVPPTAPPTATWNPAAIAAAAAPDAAETKERAAAATATPPATSPRPGPAPGPAPDPSPVPRHRPPRRLPVVALVVALASVRADSFSSANPRRRRRLGTRAPCGISDPRRRLVMAHRAVSGVILRAERRGECRAHARSASLARRRPPSDRARTDGPGNVF